MASLLLQRSLLRRPSIPIQPSSRRPPFAPTPSPLHSRPAAAPRLQRQHQPINTKRWQSSTSSADKKPPERQDPIPVPGSTMPPPPVVAPFWLRLGPLTRATQAYGRAQRRRPWLVQLCTSLVIFFLGDVSAQRMSGREYDAERTGRALVIGGLVSIPNYEWFMFLSRNFNYTSRLLSLATKIAVNQAVFTPLFNSYFFGMQALLAGDTLAEVWARIQKTVPVSMVNSLKVWPVVTAINFSFVPIEYRSVFAGGIAVGWQTYLSWLNRRAEEDEARERERAAGGRITPSSMEMVAA